MMLCLLDSAHAQQNNCPANLPIRVEKDVVWYGRYATGSDIIVDVGEVNGNLTVRIWDDIRGTLGAEFSIGRVTIRGTDANGDAQLRILAKATADFPISPLTPFLSSDMAAVNFAGLVIENPANPNDDSLRRRTRFAGCVTGSITGNITLGQVQRIQAGLAGTSIGTIEANMTDAFAATIRSRTTSRPAHACATTV